MVSGASSYHNGLHNGGVGHAGSAGAMSLVQRTQNAEAELLFQQMNGGGRGGGNCMPPASSASLAGGASDLLASASPFGMSPNAPTFTPGMPIGSSGSGGAGGAAGGPPSLTSAGGVSFEQESLRAVRACPPNLPPRKPSRSSPELASPEAVTRFPRTCLPGSRHALPPNLPPRKPSRASPELASPEAVTRFPRASPEATRSARAHSLAL